jgi:V/A-type H+-transporting ATPase subunit D
MTERTAATRLGLLRTRRRLERVERGIDMLRHKREALVAELFRAARPAVEARRRVAEAAAEAHRALFGALAAHGADGVRALGWPPRDLTVDIDTGHVWGVAVPRVVDAPPLFRALAARGVAPGAAGPSAVTAARGYERLIDLIVAAAPHELLLAGLGRALARTSRQESTLDRRVAPDLRGRIRSIAAMLSEREREDQARLRHLRRRR